MLVLQILCVRVFFNPCPSFPMVPEGTDLLECKQPWITVGSLFQLHKATKPWEQSFTQLVIIRVYNSGTASQMKLTPRIPYLLRTFPRFVFKEDFGCLFFGFSQQFSRQCSFVTAPFNLLVDGVFNLMILVRVSLRVQALQSVLLVTTQSIKSDFNLNTTVNHPSAFPLPLLVCFYVHVIVHKPPNMTQIDDRGLC